MRQKKLDSLSLKIHSFLKNAGYDADPSDSSATQLVSYFESKYGLKMMGFFESEWLTEQIDRDLTTGDFKGLRKDLDADHRDAFDSDLKAILD